ncbi:MAG: hypothetical protein ABSF55_00365 [Candidatus Staskawiczbacteria bacterium]
MSAEQVTLVECPICHVKSPLMNSDGKHNFCPHSTEDGKVISICMGCKVDRIGWKWGSSTEIGWGTGFGYKPRLDERPQTINIGWATGVGSKTEQPPPK